MKHFISAIIFILISGLANASVLTFSVSGIVTLSGNTSHSPSAFGNAEDLVGKPFTQTFFIDLANLRVFEDSSNQFSGRAGSAFSGFTTVGEYTDYYDVVLDPNNDRSTYSWIVVDNGDLSKEHESSLLDGILVSITGNFYASMSISSYVDDFLTSTSLTQSASYSIEPSRSSQESIGYAVYNMWPDWIEAKITSMTFNLPVSTPAPNPQPELQNEVPEPNIISLMGLGILCLIAWRRRN